MEEMVPHATFMQKFKKLLVEQMALSCWEWKEDKYFSMQLKIQLFL